MPAPSQSLLSVLILGGAGGSLYTTTSTSLLSLKRPMTGKPTAARWGSGGYLIEQIDKQEEIKQQSNPKLTSLKSITVGAEARKAESGKERSALFYTPHIQNKPTVPLHPNQLGRVESDAN